MPSLQNFSWIKFQDGTLTMQLEPPVPVTGRSVAFALYKRFGGVVPLIQKYMASGYYGVSGMNIAASGLGLVNISINSLDTSGLDPGNYAGTIQFTDSGSKVPATLSYFQLMPNNLNA